MRFFYQNNMGDRGHFTLKKTEIPKAIMSAWNIEANLSIVVKNNGATELLKLVFSPYEDNEVNNDFLKDYGLYMVDGEKFRELHYINDDSLAWEPDNWTGLVQLV